MADGALGDTRAGRARPAPVKSADRALSILEIFAADPTPRTYSDLLRLTDLPRSSLHGLLVTLATRGWLIETEQGATYTLGAKALEAGAAYVRSNGQMASISRVLDVLAANVSETLNVGRLDGSQVVYLAVRRSKQALSMRSAVGLRLPAYATAMGKVLLSSLPDDQIRQLLPANLDRLARNTHSDIETLLSDIRETRRRGYAIESEEVTDGIGCIAVLVEYAGNAPLSISASFPLVRQVPGMEHKLLEALDHARELLAAALSIDPGAEIE